MNSVSWRRLVLADAGLDDRRVGQVGEASASVAADLADRVGVDEPVAVGRVERRAVAIGRDLDAAAVHRRDPVERAVVVDPAGQPLGREPAVARRGPRNTTSCFVTRDRVAEQPGKRRGSHGPAAKTNVGRRRSANRPSRRHEPATVRSAPGPALAELEPAARRGERRDRGDPAPRRSSPPRARRPRRPGRRRASAASAPPSPPGSSARPGSPARSASRSSAPRSHPRVGEPEHPDLVEEALADLLAEGRSRRSAPRATSPRRTGRRRGRSAGSGSRRRTSPADGRPRRHR